MADQGYTRRKFIGLAGTSTLFLVACTGTPALSGNPGDNADQIPGLPDVEGGQVITDPAMLPAKFAESPEFAALVAAGKLRPVAERIGENPLVIKPVRDIGKYGGTLRRGFFGVGDFVN